MAVGDIMLARTVGTQIQERGPEIVFAGVLPVLDSADILVGNLECALTTSTEQQPKSYTFAASPDAAKRWHWRDSICSAWQTITPWIMEPRVYSIHAMSWSKTESVPSAQGRIAAEAHTPVIFERNGLRLAFLAYVDVPDENAGFDTQTWIATASQPGIAWADPTQMKIDISAAKLQADVVVVLLHSGLENSTVITFNQRAEAYAAIDAGAALVIGSHSHILQSIEEYHGGQIAFSLGNFVFDDYKGISNASIILQVVLTQQGVQGIKYVPVLIENGLPTITKLDNARGIETLVAP